MIGRTYLEHGELVVVLLRSDWKTGAPRNVLIERADEASGRWWSVFAMREIERTKGEGWVAVLLVHPDSGTVIESQQHEANGRERFDPARTGFDHLGLLVGSRDELDEWQEHRSVPTRALRCASSATHGRSCHGGLWRTSTV